MPAEDGILIALPGVNSSNTYLPKYQCAFNQDLGKKKHQEDGVVLVQLKSEDLRPKDNSLILEPRQIGYRLWTSHLQIHEAICSSQLQAGSTACSTVYDGNTHLITALLGDSVCFAVVYDSNDLALSVTRLNSLIHHPDNKRETIRIQSAGGYVSKHRVSGRLAMSRAMGDNDLAFRKKYNNKTPVTSESQIDIIDYTTLPGYSSGCKVQIIACSDGFTDGNNGDSNKKSQEIYLFRKLLQIYTSGTLQENDLAEQLVINALLDGSTDNDTEALKKILVILDQNNILTHRNVLCVAKINNLSRALLNINVDRQNKLITWFGPTLHTREIDTKHCESTEYQQHSEILKNFREQLMQTSNLSELKSWVQNIMKTTEYDELRRSHDLHRFFHGFKSSSIRAFEAMVTQQTQIIDEIERMLVTNVDWIAKY